MDKETFNEETYDFKKAMQAYVREEIAPFLKENGFTKYGTLKYVREMDGLAQFIIIRVAKYEVRIFAYYLPIFYPNDHISNFGIELTGCNGGHLLNGKYFTTIYEMEKFDRAIQFQNYKTKHISSMKKISNAIREGIIPEMNEISSFEIFVSKLKEKEPCFFGNQLINEFRKGFVYQFIMAIDECMNGEVKVGIQKLSKVSDLLPDDDVNELIKRLINISTDAEITKEMFYDKLEFMCDERRKKYKLKTKCGNLGKL